MVIGIFPSTCNNVVISHYYLKRWNWMRSFNKSSHYVDKTLKLKCKWWIFTTIIITEPYTNEFQTIYYFYSMAMNIEEWVLVVRITKWWPWQYDDGFVIKTPFKFNDHDLEDSTGRCYCHGSRALATQNPFQALKTKFNFTPNMWNTFARSTNRSGSSFGNKREWVFIIFPILDIYLEIDLGIDQDLEIEGDTDDEHGLDISYFLFCD